jgi:hypothetical protein
VSDEGGGASITTDPASGTSSATDVSLREHLAARLHDAEKRIDERDRLIREADMRLRQADLRFSEERDRRYAEVDVEREKALAIKEKADEAARVLVAANQAYRDEKANELREQISRERLLYATKDDVVGVVEKVEALIGTRSEGAKDAISSLNSRIATVGVLLGILVVVANYVASH